MLLKLANSIFYYYKLVIRNLWGAWRMFKAVRLNTLVFLGVGLVLGFSFFQSDYDQKGTKARAGLLYYSLIVTNLITVRKYFLFFVKCF